MEEVRLTKRERRALAKEEKKKEHDKNVRARKISKWVVWLLIIAALLFGGYKLVKWVNTPEEQQGPVSVALGENEWSKGNPQADVTLIEYSDFQCPACKTYYPLIRRLSEEKKDELRIVYRHLPLVSIHKNSIAASKAAEAAGRQGKFWEMHDALFDKQDDWSDDSKPEDKFESYASELGLDLEKFKSDFESSEVENDVNSDLRAANSLRLNSTPSFILNGRKIENPRGYEDLKKIIEDEIRGYSLE